MIFSDTLGLSPPWQVTAVALSEDENRLDITVAFDFTKLTPCPDCGTAVVPAPGLTEVWYHGNFFQHPTYLVAHIPRLDCACGHSLQIVRPWSRTGSRFTQLAEWVPQRRHSPA